MIALEQNNQKIYKMKNSFNRTRINGRMKGTTGIKKVLTDNIGILT